MQRVPAVGFWGSRNRVMTYSQAFDFACQCLVADEFLNTYGSELQWMGTELDFGELFTFIQDCLAKI